MMKFCSSPRLASAFPSWTALLWLIAIYSLPSYCQSPADDCAAIQRSLPPLGVDIPAELRAGWIAQLNLLEQQSAGIANELLPDVEVLLKACRMALDFQELYTEKDFAKVDRVLQLAEQRMSELAEDKPTWPAAVGRQVRGFRSQVDESAQPLGLVLPDGWQTAATPLPLYVWLHGRGDKSTDLHFICERLDKDGQITPPGAIVVHPFGRQCIGYKSAGETVGSSRVDLQACKLEYSIVSPK